MLHYGPGLQTEVIALMPEGSEFDVACWNTSDDVEGNPIWLHGIYQSPNGPVEGDATDYYVDTHWNTTADLTAQGIPECGSEAAPNLSSDTTENPQQAETVAPFVSFDRNAARNWARAHARDTPPNAGSCTWFVSQALAAGGFPQTDVWNTGFVGINRAGFRYGTDAAWKTSDLMAYMGSLPYVDIEPLGQLKTGINNLPDARAGDVIVYDWEGNGSPDHADVVVGAAQDNPQYPLVSGWSENGSEAVNYKYRGWTWSAEHDPPEWLQSEPGHQDMQAWLIHIRTEDELNISVGG